MMLEGLDDIDWRSLTHAYGPAGDVPETLRALAAGRASAEDAAGLFWGSIWHQGTVYEATAYAVPFLIGLLGDEKIGDREWLLLLLRSLASGSSYLDVHGPMPDQEPQAFETARQEEKGWVSTAREAVREGISLYLTLLNAEAPALRTTAAYLLSEFPERSQEILSGLRRRLPVEPDPDASASLLLCLGMLGDEEATTSNVLEKAMRGRKAAPQRLAAALGLIWRDKEASVPAAARIVQDVLAAPETFPEAYVFSAWDIEADPGVTLYESLLLLGSERAVPALLDVLDRAEEPADVLIDTLLIAAFPYPQGSPIGPDDLTPAQRNVLAALLGSDAVWDEKGKWLTSSIGSAEGEIGLPQTRQGVEELLERGQR